AGLRADDGMSGHYGNGRCHDVVPILELDRSFADEVATRFSMTWRFKEVERPQACDHFRGRDISIHHSFLPGFKGAKAYHQANEHTISAEDFVSIGSDMETLMLNRAVKWHAEGRVFVNGRKSVVSK
ncbi:MAG: hypothetical protein ABIT36_10805, partial [Steroidobacteraceae bacterium]